MYMSSTKVMCQDSIMYMLLTTSDGLVLSSSLLQVLLKSVNADGSSTKLTEMAMKVLLCVCTVVYE